MVEGDSNVRTKVGKQAIGRAGSMLQRLQLNKELDTYICENCGYVELHASRVR
jgi:hypothetical protein